MVKRAFIAVSPFSGRRFLLRIIPNGPASVDIRDYVNRSLHLVLMVLPVIGGLLISCFLLASCSTLTEAELVQRTYEREDRLIVAREKFERAKVACQQNGGSIMISRFSSGRLGKFTSHDYNMAQCVRF